MIYYNQGETMAKSKTSTAVKRKYNEKTYTNILIALPKQLAEDFKIKCKADNISMASIVKKAIEEYLSK